MTGPKLANIDHSNNQRQLRNIHILYIRADYYPENMYNTCIYGRNGLFWSRTDHLDHKQRSNEKHLPYSICHMHFVIFSASSQCLYFTIVLVCFRLRLYLICLSLIIIWSRDTRLTILIIFRGWISQDNLSVARDRNNLSVLILNLLRIRDVIIYNLMTLHSYHNTCGNIWKIAGQFTQVKCSASKICQWIFSNSFYKLT